MCGKSCIYKVIYAEMCNSGTRFGRIHKTGEGKCASGIERRDFTVWPYIMFSLVITCIYFGEF